MNMKVLCLKKPDGTVLRGNPINLEEVAKRFNNTPEEFIADCKKLAGVEVWFEEYSPEPK